MTPQEKRKAKKYSKLFFMFAYMFVTLFVIGMIFLVVRAITTEERISAYLGLTILFAPVLLVTVLGGIGQIYLNKRIMYRVNINTYRRRLKFIRCVNFILNNQHQDAINVFNTVNKKDDHIFNLLYGLLIGTFLNSEDKVNQEKALENIMSISELFNPNKIKF